MLYPVIENNCIKSSKNLSELPNNVDEFTLYIYSVRDNVKSESLADSIFLLDNNSAFSPYDSSTSSYTFVNIYYVDNNNKYIYYI